MESAIIAGAFTILGAVIAAGSTFLASLFERRVEEKRRIRIIKEELYEKIVQDYEEMIVEMAKPRFVQDKPQLLSFYENVFIKRREENVGKESIYLDKEFNLLLNQTFLQIRKDILDKDKNAFIHSRQSFDKVIEYIKKDIQK